MRRFCFATAVAVAVVLGAATGAQGQTDPGSVARALIDAENAHNVDAAVALFADDAVVTLPTGRLTTKDQIRGWQSELAGGNFKATINTPQVSGERVTFSGSIELDAFRKLGLDRLESNWDLTIQQGKVKTFTFNFTAEAGARLQEAMARAKQGQGSPPIARTGVPVALWVLFGSMALLGGGGLVLVGRRPKETATSSRA